MRKKERIAFIQETLQKLFPNPKVPLKHTSLYTLLIAVLLSARCTDKKVNEITPLLFKKANTPQKMVKLSVADIQKIIKPCGLSPAKAKAIHKLSEILLEDYGGQVPDEMELLEKLPGVGHKTASVVMVQGFHTPAFPVDTHIHRLAKRWKLSNGKNVVQTEKDLKRLFPASSWHKLHLQMIYFGREYCSAKAHKVQDCPICSKL